MLGKKPKILSIAGSDPSGGAGIQADLKTFAAHHVFGMAAPAMLTAQNSIGVKDVFSVDSAFLRAQLDSLAADMPPSAIKCGALGSGENIEIVAEFCAAIDSPVVVDPVLFATSGRQITADQRQSWWKLLHQTSLLTPNRDELAWLTQSPINNWSDVTAAAHSLMEIYPCSVLVKGGHFDEDDVKDLLFQPGCDVHTFRMPRADLPDIHGTGCALSSAIACNLACGHSLVDSIAMSKRWLSGAIQEATLVGRGAYYLNFAAQDVEKNELHVE